ncbi:GspH/FimT family pseudopilin [Pseudoalteromonas xiamenensis]|uniref:prepilin-type N-terminal cleavage/methylation domain-containing protein n=1 Tax=Pseudoalteromonas xiamenensis TaxID=882626 RepID=UPI0027E48D95|nr:prepilin-type N-terminal cleavage/methylation domain-containing protein [Pseudoalteromonas xiamenensis]WMN59515.1 GspH/FimT family pseudopilin [Pseudoalteromonas xiamenensis]
MKKSVSGFTLMEVIVAIAILAIIASFALISNKTLLETNRAESFLLELKRNFMFARAKSTASDEIIVLCAAPPANISARSSFTCQGNWQANQVVVFVDYDEDYNFDSGTDVLLRTMELIPTHDNLKMSVTRFKYDSSGRLADGQATTIVYCPNTDDENNQQLTVSQGGTALFNGDTTSSCG